MKIGMRIPGAVSKLPLADLAAWAADTGFSALDISAPDAASVEAVRGAGLEVGTFDLINSGLLSPLADVRGAAMRSTIENIKKAADLGLTRAFGVFLPPDSRQSRGDSFRYWSESWPEVSGGLASVGIDFVCEGWPGGGPFYPALGVTPETVRGMLKLDATRGAGALKLNYDPSHLLRIGVDPLRFVSEFGAYVRHAHGKDTAFDSDALYETGNLGVSLPRDVDGSAAAKAVGFGEGWWRYCIPGDGDVNWSGAASRLQAAGFDGIISVELEDFRYNGSIEGEKRGLALSRAYLARFFG
jgi:sugar phosphate isomerase/epimerase